MHYEYTFPGLLSFKEADKRWNVASNSFIKCKICRKFGEKFRKLGPLATGRTQVTTILHHTLYRYISWIPSWRNYKVDPNIKMSPFFWIVWSNTTETILCWTIAHFKCINNNNGHIYFITTICWGTQSPWRNY
jgi:hypothetical protein